MKLKAHRFIRYPDVKLHVPEKESSSSEKPYFDDTTLTFSGNTGVFDDTTLSVSSSVGGFDGTTLDLQ